MLIAVVLGVVGLVFIASGDQSHAVGVKQSTVLLGDEAIEGNVDSEAAGRSEAFPFRARVSGRARVVAIFVGRGSARAVRVGIYTDRQGSPAALLTSGKRLRPKARAWNRITVRGVQLKRGRTYWVALLGSNGRLAYRDRARGSCTSEESAQAHLGALPSKWSHGRRWRTCPVSAVVATSDKPGISAPPLSASPSPPTQSPTPPAPSPNQTNCIKNLVACGYPSPASAGVPAGTSLTSVGQASLPSGASWDGQSQNLNINGSNVTISGLSVPGSIQIYGNNVTVTNTSVISTGGGGGDGIDVHSGATGALIEHSSITGTSSSPLSNGILGNFVNVQSVDIEGVVEGVNGGGSTIQNSYIVSGANVQGGHNEPVLAADGTSTPETIEHNTLLDPLGQTAAIDAGGPWGPLQNLTIDNNIMAGGDYVIETGCPGDKASNIVITNNRISRVYFSNGGQYGVSGIDPANTKWSNNFWDDTLKQISPSPGTPGCPVG